MQLVSAIEGIRWPAVQFGRAAELMALQRQLDESQWRAPEQLRAQQFEQLGALVAHAAQLPFWRDRFAAAGIVPGAPIDGVAWARLPLLTRRDVQDGGARLHVPAPPSHGQTSLSASGGSTGVPVRVPRTELDGLIFKAIAIRQEIWHREDPVGTAAVIRAGSEELSPELVAALNSAGGLVSEQSAPYPWRTGTIAVFNVTKPIADQAAWLCRLQPAYLLTRPNNLRLLLAHFREGRLALPTLRSVWTLSEVVDDALRAECSRVWGCPIVHNYSAAETGFLALQCPEHPHFHVQAETVLLEVLDDEGRACGPGIAGRVAVTPLQSFAMPLLRYELGDMAERGGSCACGRGLPVLSRIIGRTQDVLVLPSGERRRVDVANYQLAAIEAVREFQLVQVALDTVEVRLVAARPLDPPEEASIRANLAVVMGRDVTIVFTYHEALPRTPAGKLRTFVSEVPAPADGA